jgi:hypothetical protein
MAENASAKHEQGKGNEKLKSDSKWNLKTTDKYEISLKWFNKKNLAETRVLLVRLGAYIQTLNLCNEPQQITHGWLHNEPHGVKAITEKGGGSSLKAMRLYFFPHKQERLLYLLIIGDKNSQKNDIKYCNEIVTKNLLIK